MPLLAVTQTHLKPIDALNSFLNTPSAGPIIGLLIFVGVIKLILALASPPKKSRIKSKRSSNGHSVSQMSLQSPPQATSRERSRPVSAAAKARGEKAEIIVRDELAMELQPDIYFVFHDILIPTAQGNLAQIDHVVVSVFGVFVIETKHIGGWIFGKADDPRWTHQFPDGTKEDRQNPLLQNQGHIRALAHLVQAPELYFCNLVRLIGNAELKTGPVPGVMKDGMTDFIKYFQNPLFTLEDARRMYRQIMMADLSKCSTAKECHLQFVQRKDHRRNAA